MNNECIVTLIAAGALIGALFWCWTRRLTAWLRWKREQQAEAERLAACREVSEKYRELSEIRRKRAELLEKENIKLHDALRQATGDVGFTLPRDSSIATVMQSAIEVLKQIDERISMLDIGEENRERLRYELEKLMEKLTDTLEEFSGNDAAGSDDPEDDFGAARALELGSGGTPIEQAAAPDQPGTLPPETPRPSNDNPSTGPRDVRKKSGGAAGTTTGNDDAAPERTSNSLKFRKLR